MVEWLHHRGLTLATAQSDDLQALLAERLEGGYKATSSARLLSAVRRLFQYLYREKFREDRSQCASRFTEIATAFAKRFKRSAGRTFITGTIN
ncbi:site-specific integrase [Escherichia coli]